ncbi:alpha/beta hydrolase [Mesorhizobium sp. J428]|uniref:alpha/beta hydrolase n=1 Tax=Mesorhizobium sp. J428 TaxID=2898440 RepID=UPI0021512CD4|nr:lysophospholipase [Mesorhizobium sp. J428]MCR5857177.1 alpha/beta hydrolase [Mesorhizobium sp. J428]
MKYVALALGLMTSFADAEEITAPGPQSDLAGTYLAAGESAPVVLIVPGSGPTDRDGNNPLGVRASTYRLLAEELAERGVSSVRADKRGMFASAGAVPDPNAVTIADYATDVHSWVGAIREKAGVSCVWVLGHSEGALVALQAGQMPDGICGLLLVCGPGRKLGDVLRAQLQGNPANAPYLPQMLDAITTLEAGGSVDTGSFPPAVAGLFAPAVQGFLRDLFSHDPAKLIASVTVPVLILQGEADLQIGAEDARLLAAARPDASLALIPHANHVLKVAPANDLAANFGTYADPSLPLAPGVVDALAGFVLGETTGNR